MNPNDDIVTPNPDAGNDATTNNFDGFGGPNISYESYNSPEEQTKIDSEKKHEEVTISLTNANGVVSGRPTVDASWKSIAKALMGVSAVFCVGMVVAAIIAVMQINAATNSDKEMQAKKRELTQVYQLMNVSDLVGAQEVMSQEKQQLNGSDIDKINSLLTQRFGAGYKIDFEDDKGYNFIRYNGRFKVASLGIIEVTGTRRVFMYGNIASGEWTMGKFNLNTLKPCENVQGDEAKALKGVIDCAALQEEIDDEQNEEAKKKAQEDQKAPDTPETPDNPDGGEPATPEQ